MLPTLLGSTMATVRWALFIVLSSCVCADLTVTPSDDDQTELMHMERLKDDVPYMLEEICCSLYVLREIDEFACEDYREGFPITNEEIAELWLAAENETDVAINYMLAKANFRYNTNITSYNAEFKQTLSMSAQSMGLELRKQAERFDTSFFSETNQRMFYLLLRGGIMDDPEKRKEDAEVATEMVTIYSTGKVCLDNDAPASLIRQYRKNKLPKCLDLEPHLESILSTSRNEKELRWVWAKWRDAVGPRIGHLYPRYVELTNYAARTGGYQDRSEVLLEKYEENDFESIVMELWEEVKPMYLQLHAYVRRKLRDYYGDEVVGMKTIDAHLLGNMWAQQWQNIYDIVVPYPDVEVGDVTNEMLKQNYTVLRMFETAERFFTSIGLDPMPESFWEKSMLVRPSDRQVTCHGSASDLSAFKDVRIKMCTEINMDDLHTVHHEMGHVEYYLMYNPLPIVFREGANPGFHEAVGDTIGLSAVAPDYLHKIGLLPNPETDMKADINYLMLNALEKIAFLPFGLLIDQWRWKVFRGEITPEHYNQEWWRLRYNYQGLQPPVRRTNDDFDPGAKYHIPALTPYIRYFVSFLIQFQFHRSLCDEAGFDGPLHKCHIYQSTRAGEKLREMLSLGISRPWQDAMEVLTGQRRIDTSAIKEYFEPLIDFLEEDNKKNNEKIGWPLFEKKMDL